MRPLQREAAKHQQHHQQSEDERAEDMHQQQEGGLHQSKKDTQAQRQQTSSPNSSAPFSSTRRVGARGGPQLFAQKLFTLVEEEDPAIVEWLPDGLAFRVKDIHRFSNEVLEKYFNREYDQCGVFRHRAACMSSQHSLVLVPVQVVSSRFRHGIQV